MAIPVNGSWTLTFDEEFNGTAIDTAKWGTNWLGADGAITKPINSEELAAYDPNQVSVAGGLLHLNAIASPVTVNGINYDYRSGIVQSYGSFRQAYGYFEARINLQGTDGQIADWPAFWTTGETWPTDGEMDIMEGLGGSAAYNFHTPNGGRGAAVAGDYTGWHTYGALWEPNKVSFYYDNELVGFITGDITSAPQYLILNLGIGVNSILQVPAEMQVDWVHVYSSDTAAVAVAPQENYTGPGGNPAAGPQIITGTDGDDVLYGTGATESIFGLAGNDTIFGQGGADVLSGGDGNDALTGSGGQDRLDGGSGDDTMVGGAGGDTYVADSVGDVIIENAGEGTDLVETSITWMLGANLENLTLTGAAAIDGTGNSLVNSIAGNDANNVLDGGGGADTMAGGLGGDSYVVDDGGDVVIENSNAGLDTVQASATYALAANVENLILTGGAAINGTGNGLDNVLTGNGGDNVLDGGTGADTMLGGLGNDTYVVDNAGDVVSENSGEGADTVQASITMRLPPTSRT